MEVYRDDAELTDMHMIQRVVDMFESRPGLQRMVRFGLLGLEFENELDDPDEVDYKIDNWGHENLHFRGYPRHSDGPSSVRGLGRNPERSTNFVYQPPMHYYPSEYDFLGMGGLQIQEKESDTERNARLLKVIEKKKEKTEKKRLKRQNQKRKKQLEKEKQNQKEGKTDGQQPEAGEIKLVDEKSKGDTNTSVKKLTSAKDTESSEDISIVDDGDTSDFSDSEELDMSSTFVAKAALIAQRKLEQKPRHERKEKKSPVKEPKTIPVQTNADPEDEKKDFTDPNVPTIEDNIKISTELAVIGNRFASSGDFNRAVKYFTHAIKYNPTEFKLFGNRSFCFERMQEYGKALTDAELCLNLCPGWVKGLFRKGRALAGLKRYEEAAEAFRGVLKLDGSYAEAAQELMRVQMTQLMNYGFSRDQSENALIIHGTVKKAFEVLSKLNHLPGAIQTTTLLPAQVLNATGVSPVLSANTHPVAAAAFDQPQSQDAPKTSLPCKPSGPVQIVFNLEGLRELLPHRAMKSRQENNQPTQELFPVWVGNLIHPVTEPEITKLFRKAGVVYSAKVLSFRHCAFVNFTKQEYCDEAIRRFHGYDLNGNKMAVRYPDRIPPSLGISRSAHTADDLQFENTGQNTFGFRRPVRPTRHDHRDNDYNN